MEHVIEIDGLCKTYPAFSLSEISFAVPTGCIAGFIGLNGSGKTTTIRAMLGLIRKDGGEIRLLGKSLEDAEMEIKDSVGIVFDEGYLYDSLSMKEMKKIVSGAYSRWDEDRYRALMERFSLNEKQRIATLSKGMKMKFALTLALSHHAELLLMDEPTSGLDPLVRRDLMQLLQEFMKEGGKAVFYSTHITSDLDKFADLIVFLHKGKIVFVKDKDELLDSFFLVKGDKAYLNEANRAKFLHLKETDYGFSGVSDQVSALKLEIPGLLIERVDIETLMLAFVEGGSLDD